MQECSLPVKNAVRTKEDAVGEPADTGGDRWALRSVPADLERRYLAEGWWNDATLGSTVADGLARLGGTAFQVHSKVRPWTGTFADVDRAARALAATLQARGVGPGQVVVIQLPNWVEAGVAFWAAAYLGAVVIPIVHFYGAKEVGYILAATAPDVVITAERFGHNDYLAVYTELLDRQPVPLWLVVGDSERPPAPGGGDRVQPPCSTPNRSAGPVAVDPGAPALVGLHVGDHPRPQGRRPLAPDHRLRDAPARLHVPQGRSPLRSPGAPVGHFIGMLNAFLVPLLRTRPVHLIDVWDPG